jgi:hypothetical protein
MRFKILIIFIINLLYLGICLKPVLALEHNQKDGLFSMDVPEGWHWFEYPQEIIITYSDGKTLAIDMQLVPSIKLSQADIKKTLKEGNDRMIKEGIEAHNGILIDDKEISIDGIYATQLDFRISPQSPVTVTYISFFNKGYAFTVTYGSGDDKIRSVMDDAVATIKFN